MARKTYSLTDATFKALAGCESSIAREMECDPTYIHQIKRGDSPDPFPKFRELYRATKHGGGDTSYWRNELNAIEAVGNDIQAANDLNVRLLSKINIYADAVKEIVQALADGKIDARECHRLIGSLAVVQKNIDATLDQLHRRLADLEGHASQPGNVHMM